MASGGGDHTGDFCQLQAIEGGHNFFSSIVLYIKSKLSIYPQFSFLKVSNKKKKKPILLNSLYCFLR
jgi:hypothetical protein